MTSRQGRISPGPSWAILSQPASSQSSLDARASVGSYNSDHEPEVDMADDEPERGGTSRMPAGPSNARPLPSQTPRLNPNSNAIGISRLTNSSMAKRKASSGADNTTPSGRIRPPKVPRLDLGAGMGEVRGGVTSVGADRPFSSSIPLSTPIQGGGKSVAAGDGAGPSSPTEHRSTASTSPGSSDFPYSLSHAVRKAVARDEEREREKEPSQTRGLTLSSTTRRNSPIQTARKHTVQAKNVRRVTTEKLLKDAQKKKKDARIDESSAWTRVRPKFKQRRTNYTQEMAHTQPLDMAKQRRRSNNGVVAIDNNTFELTDSGDSSRRRHASQPSSALANKDDPIIIVDSSDDNRVPVNRPRRGRGSDRPRQPPPQDADVISIPDSEEDVFRRPSSLARPAASAAQASTSVVNSGASSSRLSQGAPAAPLSARTPAIAPTPALPVPALATVSTPAPPASTTISSTAPTSFSTQLPHRPPSTPPDIQRQDDERPPEDTPRQETELPSQHSPSPSYEPPPDDFDDPFGNMDFDTGGNDAHPSPDNTLAGWDGFDMGPSLATLPVTSPSGSAAATVPEGTEDVLGSDALFDSYMNMDQLGGNEGVDQGAEEDVHPGGDEDGAGEQTEQDVMNTKAPACEGGEREKTPISGTKDGANVDQSQDVDEDANGGADVRMGSLEEGKLDKDTAAPSTRTPESPKSADIVSQKSTWTLESGEIRSQQSRRSTSTVESGEINSRQPSRRVETPNGREIWSQKPRREAETPESGEIVSSRGSSRSEEVRPAVVPLAHLPPSSSLSPSSASSGSAASQSLGRTRTLVMPDISSYKSVRFKRTPQEARQNSFFSRALSGSMRPGRTPTSVAGEETCAPDNVAPPVDMLASDNKVQSKDGGADVQDDTATSISEAPAVSSPKAAVPMLNPQTDTPIAIDVQRTTTTDRARSLSAEPSTTANDLSLLPPPSTQPPPSSGHNYTLQFQTPPATQPIIRKSSRPFIAPPRVPNPSTPMSLVDLFNDLRRNQLQTDKEKRERELVRKRDGNAKSAASHEGSPSRSQSSTSSLSSASRMALPTPSLNEIRALLARRNTLPASQVARPEPATPTPVHQSNDEDVDDGVSSASVSVSAAAVSAPVLATPAPVHPSSDEVYGTVPGSEPVAVSAPSPATMQVFEPTGNTIMKDAAGSTPNPKTTTDSLAMAATSSDLQATTSGPSVSLSASAKKSRISFVPFEAFISPLRTRGGTRNKGKSKQVGHAATWSRASMGMGTSLSPLYLTQRPKHKGRKSESDAFATYIVRGAAERMAEPRAHAGTSTETDTDTDANANTEVRSGRKSLERSPLRRPRFPEGPRSLSLSSSSIASPEIRDAVSPASPDMAGLTSDADGDEDGEDEDADDTNVMDVGCCARDGAVESAHVEEGAVLGKSGEAKEIGETDETETLSQLASVHLSLVGSKPELAQPETTKEDVTRGSSVDKVGEMDAMVESTESSGAEEEEDRAATDSAAQVVKENAIVVDEPREEVEMSTCAPETTSDEAPSPPDPMEGDAISVAHVESIEPASADDQDDSATSPVELPSISRDSDEDAIVNQRPNPSGGVDSADECDALLTSRSEQCELEELEGMVSSHTASSSSLVPPRTHSRSSRSSSKRRSPSADTHLVDTSGVSRQLGEYRTLTWTSWVAELRERPPEYRLAKNLSHSLQDHMNIVVPLALRNSDFGRKVFEAHIREAMSNEPDAPAIEIFDNGIGDESTPAWEFCYTNELWYGEGVPPPDVKGLQSCGCVGRCDPKSKTCACAQQQRLWTQSYIEDQAMPPTWPGSPFLYDHKGLLQRLECCPIFECNRFCSCDEDCPNRVVQNGRKWPVHIAKTDHKGWGVFAGNKKIPKGSFIGIYAGELLTEQEGEERGRYYDLYGRTYLFSIDFHHLKLGMENPDDWDNLYVVDAYHAGNFTRFLNHSCDPNCGIFACYIDDADVNKPLLAVFTTRDVEAWEELCFSYYGDIEDKREEIQTAKDAGESMAQEYAVHAKCRCEAENCIGRLFS